MASDRDSKVIGYFAYVSPAEVVCTGDACVISGSESAMRDYLIELNPDREGMHTIRKTRFAEIMFGIRSGAAYAFDEEAYSRFYPLAREAGLHVAVGGFRIGKVARRQVFHCQGPRVVTPLPLTKPPPSQRTTACPADFALLCLLC